MDIKNDFKTGNTTNSVVSLNVLTNHAFDFQNSAIFAFIHDKNNRRIMEACSIAHNNTIPQQVFLKSFFIYRKNDIKRIQNSHDRLVSLSLNMQSDETSRIRFSNYETPFSVKKEKKKQFHRMTWRNLGVSYT